MDFGKITKESNNPKTQIIKLSNLNNEYEDKKRRECIIDYWDKNILITKSKLYEVNSVLKQFEEAKQQNRDDKKLNEVELHKLFLSLKNLIKDTLEPFCSGSICFPNIEKITNNENDKKLQKFVFDDGFKEKLSEQIENLKIYFEQNGSYVPYGKVTLNKYTASQKSNEVNNEIKELVRELKLLDFIKKYKNGEQLNDFIKTTQNKSEKINDNELSLMEIVQLFKYKTIPTGVQQDLSQYLSENHSISKEQIKKLLEETGKPKSPDKNYKDLRDKQEFDLYQYPLKVAFDYAWESLAKNEYCANMKFPKEKCQEFLKEIFNVDVINDNDFKLYFALLFIRENLAKLDYNKPNNKDIYINNIKNTFSKIDLKKNYTKYIDTINSWHNKRNTNQLDYDKAKQNIGRLRGGLKNKVAKYLELTNLFKKLSPRFGKAFAEFRDKLNERYEINKITHCGVVIEDSSKDQYLLLSVLSDDKREAKTIFELANEANKELKLYQVKSLTSKTLLKLIKNEKGVDNEYPFHNDPKPKNWWKVKRKWSEVQGDNNILDHIKKCLKESKISTNQDWMEFGWHFNNCDTYEKIEKEIDAKGYILKYINISKPTIENLIKNKNCLLLLIANQDIIRKDRKAKNQFTKDWEEIFADNNGYRLHPEFKIFYQHPTPSYPKPGEKRYSRFQMIAHLLCEYIPKNNYYITRKEQIKIFSDKKDQKNSVEKFNEQLKIADDYYIFGIDRGRKQLATLCILNKNGQIQGGFEIYTREFDEYKKQWKHSLYEKRNILNLSNLRAETTVEGEKVLVDLSEIAVKIKDEQGQYIKDDNGRYKKNRNNRQNIKLKQLAYIRKLQFQMQDDKDKILCFIEQCKTQDEIKNNIHELITPYNEGKNYHDLPLKEIQNMLLQFAELALKSDENSKIELRKLCELDAADRLKKV